MTEGSAGTMTVDAAKAGSGQVDAAEPSGRAAVRQFLLAPLDGLPRPRRVSAESHAKNLDRIISKLAYMTPGNLRALVDVVLRNAGSPKGPVWPEVPVLLSWAFQLQVPPPSFSDYPRSLMRSEMGRRAFDEGWHVELYQIARRLGPPPGKYIIAKLVDGANENIRRRARIREWIEAGRCSQEDRMWLAAWHADASECEAVLNDAGAVRADESEVV